jgi:dolichol-phosphate mannosyltransferase
MGNIPFLVDEVCSCLNAEVDFEIIVVDDGSTDNTPGILQASRQAHGQLRVLRHEHRCGQSMAIATGVNAASAQWIVTLDGDGQNDPADILPLYHAMDKAPDRVLLVTGYRRQREDRWLKRVASQVANAVRARVLHDSTPDTGCGLKVFARATFIALPQFDHMHRFLPALVQRQGGRVLSLEVRHRARRHGESKYGIHDRLWIGVADLLGVRWLQRRSMSAEVSEPGRD